MVENTDIIPQENEQNILVQASRFHSGPLPTPSDLAGYEQICQGAANRIITMAESEQKSIHQARQEEQSLAKHGLYCGFFALLFVLVLIGYSIYANQPWVASVLIAALTGCGVLIKSQTKQK